MAIARGAAGRDGQGIAGGLLLHAPDLREEADLRGARSSRVVVFLPLLALPVHHARATATGSTDEPQARPRVPDPHVRGARRAVRGLVPGRVRPRRGAAAWSRPSRRSPSRSAWSSTTRGSCARRGRCDDRQCARDQTRSSRRSGRCRSAGVRRVVRVPGVLRRRGDRDDRRLEARRAGAARRSHWWCRAASSAFFLYLRKRARRMAEADLDEEWSELQEIPENLMTEWLGLPPLAAAHGGQIDSLIGWTHIFMLVLFVGWGGFFVYCLVRFRRSQHRWPNYAGVKSHSSSYLEIAVAVVEAVLLFAFSIPLWAARVDRMPSASEALVVQVTGEQFAWNIHYPGPDGKFGRTDIKLLDLQCEPAGARSRRPGREGRRHDAQSAVPAREQADHREAAEQGRHPQLRRARVPREAGRHPGAHDPHLVHPQRHHRGDAAKTGNAEFQYEIACAQLCGLGMPDAGIRHRRDPAEFEKWLAQQIEEQSAPIPPLKDEGRARPPSRDALRRPRRAGPTNPTASHGHLLPAVRRTLVDGAIRDRGWPHRAGRTLQSCSARASTCAGDSFGSRAGPTWVAGAGRCLTELTSNKSIDS